QVVFGLEPKHADHVRVLLHQEPDELAVFVEDYIPTTLDGLRVPPFGKPEVVPSGGNHDPHHVAVIDRIRILRGNVSSVTFRPPAHRSHQEPAQWKGGVRPL